MSKDNAQKSASYLLSLHIIVIVAALIILCLPAMYFISEKLVYPGHDNWLHIRWSSVFADQLWSGDLYPRWLADFDLGAGSPVMFYYSPLSYYFTAPLSLVFPGKELFFLRFNAANITLIVISFVTMRLFLKSCIRSSAKRSMFASYGALLYVSNPYFYMIDIYVRGAFPESWAFAVVPILLLGINTLAGNRRVAVACIALGSFALVTTHIVSSVYWLPIACGYLIFSWWHDKQKLVSGLVAVFLGVGMSSGYLFTALGYHDFTNISAIYSVERIDAGFLFSANALSQLFKVDFKFLEIILLISLTNVLGVVIFTLLMRKYQRRLLFWGVVLVGIVFMMSSMSRYFWAIIPMIHKIQFPWRLIGVLVFVLVIFYVSALEQVSKRWLSGILQVAPIVLSGLVAIAVITFGAGHIKSGNGIDSYGTIGDRAYQEYKSGMRPSFNALGFLIVPIEVLDKYRYFDFVEIENPSASYNIIENAPRSVILKIDTDTATKVRFKRQSYYDTEVRVNDQLVSSGFNREMIVLSLTEGESKIHISLRRMPLEVLGYCASLVAFLFLLIFLRALRPKNTISSKRVLPT